MFTVAAGNEPEWKNAGGINLISGQAHKTMKMILTSVMSFLLLCAVAPADEEQTPKDNRPIDDILSRVKQGSPQVATFIITAAWSERELNSGYSGWHFEGSTMRVKLYPEKGRVIRDENVDKKKRYRVNGVLLDQWYGVYQVWIYEMSETVDNPPAAEPAAPTNLASNVSGIAPTGSNLSFSILYGSAGLDRVEIQKRAGETSLPPVKAVLADAIQAAAELKAGMSETDALAILQKHGITPSGATGGTMSLAMGCILADNSRLELDFRYLSLELRDKGPKELTDRQVLDGSGRLLPKVLPKPLNTNKEVP